jgi:hypothetical protein
MCVLEPDDDTRLTFLIAESFNERANLNIVQGSNRIFVQCFTDRYLRTYVTFGHRHDQVLTTGRSWEKCTLDQTVLRESRQVPH